MIERVKGSYCFFKQGGSYFLVLSPSLQGSQIEGFERFRADKKFS